MRTTKRCRPCIESLEGRVQLSAIPVLDYPWNAVGPIPAGSYRIASPATIAIIAQAKQAQAQAQALAPAVGTGGAGIRGMTFAYSQSPVVVGIQFQANLTDVPANTHYPSSTTWALTISYTGTPTSGGGSSTFTTPSLQLDNPTVLSAWAKSTVPGTYTVTAVTTYSSTNPTVAPPAPTTTTASTSFAPPNGVTKGGAVNTETTYPNVAQIVDTVTSGGTPVGPLLQGWAQEKIPHFGINNWAPTDGPTQSFYLDNGGIYDQVGPAFVPQNVWDAAPIVTPPQPGGPPVVPTDQWNQDLRILVRLFGTNTKTGDVGTWSFPVSLGQLNWSMYKVSQYQYVLQ